MSDPSLRSRRRLTTTALVLSVVAFWGFTVWLGHNTRFWAITLTNCCFAVTLAVTYVVSWLVMALSSERRRRVAFRAVGTTFALVILLVILETPVVLGWLDYRELWDSWTGNWRGPVRELDVDLELGFRRTPNTTIIGRPQGDIAGGYNLTVRSPRTLKFTYNAQGFRSLTEYTSADVVLLGDSFIEGWYVSDGETCADLLAKRTGLAVANLGQSGYGTVQEWRMLELEGVKLGPRMVVWFFYEGNDLYNDQDFKYLLEYYKEENVPPEELRRRMAMGRIKFSSASFTVNAFAVLRRACDWLVPNEAPYSGWFRDREGQRRRLFFYSECLGDMADFEIEQLEVTRTTFAQAKTFCDGQDISLLVCYIPTKFRVVGDFCEFDASSPCRQWRMWDLPNRFADFCRQDRVPFLDLTGPMRDAARAGKLLYAPQDSHWDVAAHAFVAELLQREWEHPAASSP